jgi:hypothetical protein
MDISTLFPKGLTHFQFSQKRIKLLFSSPSHFLEARDQLDKLSIPFTYSGFTLEIVFSDLGKGELFQVIPTTLELEEAREEEKREQEGTH